MRPFWEFRLEFWESWLMCYKLCSRELMPDELHKVWNYVLEAPTECSYFSRKPIRRAFPDIMHICTWWVFDKLKRNYTRLQIEIHVSWRQQKSDYIVEPVWWVTAPAVTGSGPATPSPGPPWPAANTAGSRSHARSGSQPRFHIYMSVSHWFNCLFHYVLCCDWWDLIDVTHSLC